MSRPCRCGDVDLAAFDISNEECIGVQDREAGHTALLCDPGQRSVFLKTYILRALDGDNGE